VRWGGQVAPHPADHAPVLLPQRVLPALLLEHGVTGRLAGTEQTPVLDAPVELAEQPLLPPPEVAATDQQPVGPVHLDL
jgi:hypothetical protein